MSESSPPKIPSSTRTASWMRTVSTYDVFPAFSARVRRFVYHPLGVLTFAAIVSLLCGLFIHAQGFVLCGGVAAVLVVGVSWPWLSLRGLSGSIAFERLRVSEDETVEVRLTLRNRLPWSAWGLALRDGFGGDASAAVAGIASAPGRRTARCR